jgi:HAD superfamily hydrolase (TIGR01509 family)
VIFDMDGLLVDSERSTRRVWQASTTDCGFELPDAVYLTLIGLGADEADRVLERRFGAGFDVRAFRDRRIERMRDLLASEGIAFKPGAHELLAWVAGAGLPCALATSSSRQEVDERLGEAARVFAAIVTRADVPRGKPSPDIYLAAASRLALPPTQCLALEDSFAGVRAAAAAAMPVAMVPDLAPPTPEIAALAAGVYSSLHEVQAELARACAAAL